jgi:hypothetical protein
MKLVALWIAAVLACGGQAFTGQALSVGPDSSAPNNAAAGGTKSAGPDDAAREAAARDVTQDPWPDDVVVEPAPDVHFEKACDWATGDGCPCVNCWAIDRPDGTTDHVICCDGSGRVDGSSNLCGEGSFPSPHKTYCESCGCP